MLGRNWDITTASPDDIEISISQQHRQQGAVGVMDEASDGVEGGKGRAQEHQLLSVLPRV
jgi:adenosine/AMP kinase